MSSDQFESVSEAPTHNSRDILAGVLYSAVMSGLEKVRMQRERILSVAARHGAERLRVFGSVALQSDGPDSDIDFLVSMRPDRDLFDLVALKRELDSLLQQPADIVTDEELSPHLRQRILDEAVAV